MQRTNLKILLAFLFAGLAVSPLSEAADTYSYRISVKGLRAVPSAEPEIPTETETPAPPVGPFHFNTCTAVGLSGPSAAQCEAAYAETSLDGLVSVANGVQSFTIPSSGTYTLTLAGAAGGTAYGHRGGYGAVLTTTLPLAQGTVLSILVGQAGSATGQYLSIVGGGGGGTFVVSGDTPLAVAGGGGASGASGGAGFDASTSTTPTSFRGTGIGWGGGGAGFATNGISGTGSVALSFLGGGTGGNSTRASGGFGGGGGGGQNGGGGGGGYSASNQGGAGGTTYSAGAILSSVAANDSSGYVTITKN